MNFGRLAAHSRYQRSFDLGSGCDATGMDNSWKRVSTFAGEFKLPVSVAIESRSKSDQISYSYRSFLDQHPNRVDITQTGSCGQRVGQMEISGVGITTKDCSNAALCPTGCGLLKRTLGEHADANPKLGRRSHGRRESGNARTNHEKIEFGVHRPAV